MLYLRNLEENMNIAQSIYQLDMWIHQVKELFQVSKEQMDAEPKILLIETRLKENVPLSEQAENVVFMSVEDLDAAAEDRSRLDPRLSDPNVQIITTWKLGNRAAVGAQILQDMGFDNVTYMVGGMTAWKEAGLPTKE